MNIERNLYRRYLKLRNAKPTLTLIMDVIVCLAWGWLSKLTWGWACQAFGLMQALHGTETLIVMVIMLLLGGFSFGCLVLMYAFGHEIYDIIKSLRADTVQN